MSQEAKIPEINTNWQSIDIYLFSNGQQFSPPRKYHMHSDELRWWNATLMHLARLHYGSLHSHIELYTLEGHKIHNPLELINGNAYVAVEPPDLFIDSGYSKYMIKATRSWEKSQARKRNSNEITKSDDYNNVVLISKSDNHEDDIPIGTSNEKIITEMVHIHAMNGINSKIEPACRDNTTLKNCTKWLKSTEKNRTPYTRRPTDLKKLCNSITCSPKKRSLTVKKDHIPKTNFKRQNLQRNEVVGIVNKVPIINKVASSPYKLKTPFSVLSKFKRTSTCSPKHPSKLGLPVNNNISSTNDVQTEVSIFKNTDNELPSMIVVLENDSEIDDIHNHNDIKEKCDTFMPIHEEAVEEVKNNALKESITTYSDDGKTNSKTFIKSTQHEANVTFSGKTNEENCIIINKGDIVNLKLHIEVQKEEVCSKTYNLVKSSRSLTNIFKDEKASQINVDDGIPVQKEIPSKPLHYLLISGFKNQNVGSDESSNFVINKCDRCECCSYALSNRDILLSQNVNSNLYVLLPTIKYNGEIKRCIHKGNQELKTVFENNEHAKPIDHLSQLIKAVSGMSLERLISKELESIRLLSDQEIPKDESKSNNSENNRSEQNELVVTKFNESKINNENVETKYIIIRNTSDYKTEDYIKAKSLNITKATELFPKSVLDKSIQTESSNILLQAILQDDGHYTFHLPPLRLLKHYKIA